MTTTTANAGQGVSSTCEFCLQVLWPELDVQLASVTEQWAQFSVAGPKARELLARIVDAPFDISNEAFPFMAAAELTVLRRRAGAAVPHLLLRRAGLRDRRSGAAKATRWREALMTAGAEFGITPYGTEALGVMRIEKGHVAGPELNGQTTAQDLGPWQDDVEEEGLHRPRDEPAPRPDRPETAGAGGIPPGGPDCPPAGGRPLHPGGGGCQCRERSGLS